MENYNWTMGLSFGGLQAEYRWREYIYDDGKSLGYWGYLVDPESDGRDELPFDAADSWLKDGLLDAAVALRRAQLRIELDLKGLPFLTDRDARKSKIMEIFHRSQQGEFMGQRSINSTLYVQDIAGLFEQSMAQVLPFVEELVSEGRLGLTGMILIPNEVQEAAFARLKEATGHGRLSLSDFGYWGCQVCGKSGDEYDDPKDFPCGPEDQAPATVDTGA